mmetsp:Transcript_77172/g.200798  ORF Transcript_77172/g.200798 Transcript_77172/m.200798 type:complete len:277 (-) Transcript_77172:440-1270(-)
MPLAQPERPHAERRVSQWSVRPPSNSITTFGFSSVLPSPASTLANLVLMINSTPSWRIVSLHASWRETSSIGTTLSKMSTTTTDFEPSFLKINAYSSPMMPAPCTTMCSGSLSIIVIVSESKTPGKSNFTGGKRLDLEPVAMTSVSNLSERGKSPLLAGVNWIDDRLSTAPSPCITSIKKVRSCLCVAASADFVAATATFLTSSHVLAPDRTASRRHLECAPVGAPVMLAFGSISPTRTPRPAASIAALTPAGPAPRTRRSNSSPLLYLAIFLMIL